MYALTKHNPTRNSQIAGGLVAALMVLGSATYAKAQSPEPNGRVQLHRQLSLVLTEISALETAIRLLPATSPQRQRLNFLIDRVRRKVTRLIAVTPSRVRRVGTTPQRPAPRAPISNQKPAKQTKAPTPIRKKAFKTLTDAVKNESFGSGQLQVIKSAARHHHFTIAQVITLTHQLSFSREKLSAIRSLYPRVVDPENAYQLHGVFTHESDKRKLQALLEN